jgi:hypothetical protein
MNNSILSIGLDKENDLWLGLDNGIVEINYQLVFFFDNTLGSVYSVVKTDKVFNGIESRCFLNMKFFLNSKFRRSSLEYQ